MHELLAVCYMVVDYDSLAEQPNQRNEMSPLMTKSTEQIRDDAMYATLDRRYVEHDAFQLFQAVMKGAKSSYEWRAEEGPVSVPTVRQTPSACSSRSSLDLILLNKFR